MDGWVAGVEGEGTMEGPSPSEGWVEEGVGDRWSEKRLSRKCDKSCCFRKKLISVVLFATLRLL